MSILLKTFGISVRELALKRGLTQKEIAQRSDCDQTQLGRYVNGKTTPSFEVVERVAGALGVAPHELVSPIPIEPQLSHLPRDIVEGLAALKDPVSIQALRGVVAGLNSANAPSTAKKSSAR